MRWFERAVVEGAKRARFAEVSTEKRRVPSWVPTRAEAERRNEPSLKPPRLPSEFVSAVRHELGQELGARNRASLPPDGQPRRSELPQASMPPPAAAPQPQPVAAQPAPPAPAPAPPPPPEPVVDPALIEAFQQ